MFDLAAIQQAIRDFGFDGWLLYDFRGSNILARRILQCDNGPTGSRRFAYCIPAHGEPRKLVHRIESSALDHLPGRHKRVYLRWQDFEEGIAELTGGMKRVAMEYAARNPYISRVDAGTIETVRNSGVSVESSGDLVQLFEASWSDEQFDLHFQAEKQTTAAYPKVWKLIADSIRSGTPITEKQIADFIMQHFAENGLTTYSPPIVGVNGHAGDPHHESSDTRVQAGDLILVDLWAKMNHPRGVYSDLTRMGFVGTEVPTKFVESFRHVTAARDAAILFVRDAFAAKRPVRGWEVDTACRIVLGSAGLGTAFVHRTGHSIGQETHGNGANMDGLETQEERQLLPRTCFSVEPGVYFPDYGLRSEINVVIDAHGKPLVTGGMQQTDRRGSGDTSGALHADGLQYDIVPILSWY